MSRLAFPALPLALAGIAAFLLGAALVPLDEQVGRALVGAPGLTLVSGGLAFLGGISFLGPTVLGLVLVLVAFGRIWGAARIAAVMALTDLATRGLKLLFARPRPEWALVEAGGYAFPSGHASSGAALAVLVAWFAARHLQGRRLVVAALVAAALYALAMATSRLVLGVHHLSDVVAGVGLGMAMAAAILAGSVPLERTIRARTAKRAEASERPPRAP